MYQLGTRTPRDKFAVPAGPSPLAGFVDTDENDGERPRQLEILFGLINHDCDVPL